MEEWTRWVPIPGLSGRYYIDFFGMVGDEWDFVITLSDHENLKKIDDTVQDFVNLLKQM